MSFVFHCWIQRYHYAAAVVRLEASAGIKRQYKDVFFKILYASNLYFTFFSSSYINFRSVFPNQIYYEISSVLLAVTQIGYSHSCIGSIETRDK